MPCKHKMARILRIRVETGLAPSRATLELCSSKNGKGTAFSRVAPEPIKIRALAPEGPGNKLTKRMHGWLSRTDAGGRGGQTIGFQVVLSPDMRDGEIE